MTTKAMFNATTS